MSLLSIFKKSTNPSSSSVLSEQSAKDLQELKGYLRNDPEKAYVFGKKFLEKEPDHEFASYITAWGASKTDKPDDAIHYASQALKTKPRSYAYLQLRGTVYFKTRQFEKALEDFKILAELEPEIPSVWKNLLNVRRELNASFPLPRNLIVIQDEIAMAYHDRKWTEYDSLLNELKTLDPLSARYREILKEEFFMRLPDPITTWESFFNECKEKNAELGFTTLSSLCNWLIKTGKTDRVMETLPLFRELYQKPVPTLLIVGICPLLIHEKRYRVCLEMLKAMEDQMTGFDMKETLKLRTYMARKICERELQPADNTKLNVFSNPLSDGLFEKITQVHYKDSAPALTLEECKHCWDKIRSTTDKILLDLRYNTEQANFLRQEIKTALSQKKPMSLIRMGDSDSYGFSEILPDVYPPELTSIMENIWWGRTIDPKLREKIKRGFVQAIQNADIIGFPSAIRLSRDMEVENIKTIYTFHRKYQTLFAGVENLLEKEKIPGNRMWVDEYCNFVLMERNYLEELIRQAVSTVIVTCHRIPKGHFLDRPNIHTVLIPPHTQVASVCDYGQDNVLPEIIDEKTNEIRSHVRPGSLLLVSAGFAGKFLIDIGKQAGAVAIDFGSAIDDMIGLKTRSSELHAQSSALK